MWKWSIMSSKKKSSLVIFLGGFPYKTKPTHGSSQGSGLNLNNTIFKPNNIILLIIMNKFDSNHVLVNANKLKPYKYMDKEVHNQNISKFFYLES